MKNKFVQIATSGSTVFSYSDLAYFFGNDKQKLTAKIAYYAKRGYLYQIKRWLYSLGKDYDIFEMATKIQKPSYISLQSALWFYGMNFQHDGTIYVVGYKTEEIDVDGKKISFKVLKKKIRENFSGIISEKGYAIASRERAVLDTLYLYKQYFFDNLEGINWIAVKELVKIYDSKIFERRVNILYANYTKNGYYSEIG